MTKSDMPTKTLRALLAAGLILCCAGCATMSLWEKTEESEVEIYDARVTTTNGVAQAVVIIGRKQRDLFAIPVRSLVSGVSFSEFFSFQ